MSLPVDIGAARSFLECLDPEADVFTFQTFTDRRPAPKHDRLAAHRTGSLDEHADWLRSQNEAGAGVFVTVNETDGKGRKGSNIARVRAVWQEDDGDGQPLPLEPHIEVETSTGHAHRYLLCDGLSPADHAEVMSRMVATYGSDQNAASLERVLRLPGFYHRKGEPRMVRLLKAESFMPYSRERILQAIEPPKKITSKASKQVHAGAVEFADENTLRDLRSALCWIDPDPRANYVANGCRLRGLGDVTGRGLWLEWAQKSAKWQPSDAQDWHTFEHDRTGYAAIFSAAQALGWPNPMSGSASVVLSPREAEQRACEAKAVDREETPRIVLPTLPADLLQMPYGLGMFQSWILGYQTYPSPANAGLTAIATLAHFAMPNVRIDSLAGLGLNEQYLVLAPTGAGKEDLRRPFALLDEQLKKIPAPASRNLWHQSLPHIQYSAPASQQGLHRLLELHNAQCFLADEFADWLGHTANDSHKYQAMSHIMQAYSKAFGTLAAPAIADKEKKYLPVQNPRVLIFATSTAERMLEAITASQADSGALNRFVTVVAEQERPQKRYGLKREAFVPPAEVVSLVRYVSQLKDNTLVTLDKDAWALHDAHDSAVLEPMKFADPRLAGRLNEQALKMAAVIALSDRRIVIEPGDLAIAYAIREGLYHRMASLVGNDGVLSGLHPTGRALEQIKRHLQKKPFVYRANLTKVSRAFAKLATYEQAAVLKAAQEHGYGRMEGQRLVSLLHEEAV